jgi:hypothetical protein
MLLKTEDTQEQEQPLGTVDVWALQHYHWPILRVFARSYFDNLELNYYLKSLLTTGHWTVLRVAPHIDADGVRSAHRFDVYGRA